MQYGEKKDSVEENNVGSRKCSVGNNPAHNVSHSLPSNEGLMIPQVFSRSNSPSFSSLAPGSNKEPLSWAGVGGSGEQGAKLRHQENNLFYLLRILTLSN